MQWIALIFLTLISLVQIASAAENSQEASPPGFIITTTDLDPKNNEIDKLISVAGWACYPGPLDRRPCPIVKKVEQFLKTLPQDLTEMVLELTRMGADCESQDRLLKCTYDRHAEDSRQQAGYAKPVLVKSSLFHFDILVKNDGALPSYQIDYSRKTIRPELTENLGKK